MNDKAFSLSLDGIDVHKVVVSWNQIGLAVLGILVLLTITTLIVLPLPVTSAEIPGEGVAMDIHTARWTALGERYRAEELNSEKVASANVARWNALGERYSAGLINTDKEVDASVARWIALGERYQEQSLEAERIENAFITRWNGLGAHYQAMTR